MATNVCENDTSIKFRGDNQQKCLGNLHKSFRNCFDSGLEPLAALGSICESGSKCCKSHKVCFRVTFTSGLEYTSVKSLGLQ